MKNSYTIYGPEKWEEYFTSQVYKYLEENGYRVCIKKKMEFSLDITKKSSNWYGVIRKFIIFQNNDTGQFFVINHADQFDYVPEEIVSHPLCICVLKCQYRTGSYGEYENKVSSFIYGVKERENYFSLKDEMKLIPESNRKMYFKGNETSRFNFLEYLSDANLINKDYGFRKDGLRNLKVPQKEYLQNMASYRISLSLPGVGNCCHREIESFGIGVPVLMPILKNSYYRNLVPNVHYISVDNRNIGNHRTRDYIVEEEKILCEMIKVRYNEVVNDDEFLEYISNNALLWFKDNIIYPSAPNLIREILKYKFNYEL